MIDLDETQLKKLAFLLASDYQMLVSSTERLEVLAKKIRTTGDLTDAEHTEWNAFLTQVLIRVRALDHFFLGKPQRDDVVAAHYVLDWSAPTGVDVLKRVRVRTNKRVAHFTAYRLREDDDCWRWFELSRAITGLWEMLLEQLPPERRPWFDHDLVA